MNDREDEKTAWEAGDYEIEDDARGADARLHGILVLDDGDEGEDDDARRLLLASPDGSTRNSLPSTPDLDDLNEFDELNEGIDAIKALNLGQPESSRTARAKSSERSFASSTVAAFTNGQGGERKEERGNENVSIPGLTSSSSSSASLTLDSPSRVDHPNNLEDVRGERAPPHAGSTEDFVDFSFPNGENFSTTSSSSGSIPFDHTFNTSALSSPSTSSSPPPLLGGPIATAPLLLRSRGGGEGFDMHDPAGALRRNYNHADSTTNVDDDLYGVDPNTTTTDDTISAPTSSNVTTTAPPKRVYYATPTTYEERIKSARKRPGLGMVRDVVGPNEETLRVLNAALLGEVNDQQQQAARDEGESPLEEVLKYLTKAENDVEGFEALRTGARPQFEGALALARMGNDEAIAFVKPGESIRLLPTSWYREHFRPFLSQLRARASSSPHNETVALPIPPPLETISLFEYYETFERPGRLNFTYAWGEDYLLCHAETWIILVAHFGGGPEMERVVREFEVPRRDNDEPESAIVETMEMSPVPWLVVDISGIELQLYRSTKMYEVKTIRLVIDRFINMAEYEKRLATSFWKELEGIKHRTWDYESNEGGGMGTVHRLLPLDAPFPFFTPDRCSETRKLMIEEAVFSRRGLGDPEREDEVFAWDPILGPPPAPPSSTYSSMYPSSYPGVSSSYFNNNNGGGGGALSYYRNEVVSRAPSYRRGVKGFQNLGNTCFMNSTLQCLIHAPAGLMNRFLKPSEELTKEINLDNPLGSQGRIATSFAEVVRMMFDESTGNVIAPRGIKHRIEERNSSFSGYGQHDAQEFLIFLIDALHEDFNRISKKPYTEKYEGTVNERDEEIAREELRRHRMRNDSFLTDAMEGFFKNKLVCPDCGHVSIKFDPYQSITLSLDPARRRRARNAASTANASLVSSDPTMELVENGERAHNETSENPQHSMGSKTKNKARRPNRTIEVEITCVEEETGETKVKVPVRRNVTTFRELRAELAARLRDGKPSPESHDDQDGSTLLLASLDESNTEPVDLCYDFQIVSDEVYISDSDAEEESDDDGHEDGDDDGAKRDATASTALVKRPRVRRAKRVLMNAKGPTIYCFRDRDGSALRAFMTDRQYNTFFNRAPYRGLQQPSPPPSPSSQDERAGSCPMAVGELWLGEYAFMDTRSRVKRRDLASPSTTLISVVKTVRMEVVARGEMGPHSVALGERIVAVLDYCDELTEEIGGGSRRAIRERQESFLVECVVEKRGDVSPQEQEYEFRLVRHMASIGRSRDRDFDELPLLRLRFPFRDFALGYFGPRHAREEVGELRLSLVRRSPGRDDDDGALPPSPSHALMLVSNSCYGLPDMFTMRVPIPTSNVGEGFMEDAKREEAERRLRLRAAARLGVREEEMYSAFLRAASSGLISRRNSMSDDEARVDLDGDEARNDPHTLELRKYETRLPQGRLYRLAARLIPGPSFDMRTLLRLGEGQGGGDVSLSSSSGEGGDASAPLNLAPLFAEGSSGTATTSGGHTTTPRLELAELLSSFSEEQKLDEMNCWKCPKCAELKEAAITLGIWTVPDVLVLHLKRFSQNPHSIYFDKDEAEVGFPLEGLDMTPYVLHPQASGGDLVYDLFAVTNHFGGLGGGHYTALARGEDGEWMEYNDSYTRPVARGSVTDTVVTPAAYLLFYVRRSKAPEAWSRMREATPELSSESSSSSSSDQGNVVVV